MRFIILTLSTLSSGTATLTTLKVLTLNTWGLPFSTTKEQRLRKICWAIKVLGADEGNQTLVANPANGLLAANTANGLLADVVLLQELWQKQDHSIAVSECGYPYFTSYGHLPYVGKFYGMVILSKYPIVKAMRGKYKWGKRLPNLAKGVLRADILIDDKIVSVFNTHLTANMHIKHKVDGTFYSDPDEECRRVQLKKLSSFIYRAYMEENPIILGGDLNTGPRYPLWNKWLIFMQTDYRDMYESMSFMSETESTYNNDFCGTDQGQIDHIIGFGGAKIVDSKVVLKEKDYMCFGTKCKYTNLSDHYGLLSTIEI